MPDTMNRQKLLRERFLLAFGAFLIAAGVIGNEWLIASWLCPEAEMAHRIRVGIRVAEAALLGIGLGMIVFRKKDLTLNLSLLLITLIIIFAGAEIFFRTFFPQYTATPEQDSLFEYDSTLGWRLIPGKTGFFVSKHEFRTKVTINSAGIRDKEYPLEKPPGRKRIVLIGDSFTSSFGVQDDEAFAKLMEDRLLRNTEVLNFGVNGYGPAQELLMLQTRAIKYRPDLVIMVIYVGNDFDDIIGVSDWIDGYRRPKAVADRQGRISFTGIPVPLSEKYLAKKREKRMCSLPRSHFIDFIDKYIRNKKYSLNFMPSEIRLCNRKPDADVKEANRLMEAIIRETDSYCKKNGASLMVAVAPTIVQVYENLYWNRIRKKYNLKDSDYDLMLPNKVLADICGRAGIPLVDLTKPLKSAIATGNDTYYFNNQHWNRAGEQVVAETLARFIEKNGKAPGQ